MADAASALIGIIAFGLHAIHKIVEIAEDIKDAPENVVALRDDAIELGCLFEQLSRSNVLDFVAIPRGRTTQVLVERLKDALDKIQTFVEEVSEARQDGTLRVRKLKWFLSAGRCQNLRENLTSLKSSTIAIVTASTSQSVLRIVEEQHQSREQLNAFRREHSRWRYEQIAEFTAFRSEIMQMLTAMALRGDQTVLMLCAESSGSSGGQDNSSTTVASVADVPDRAVSEAIVSTQQVLFADTSPTSQPRVSGRKPLKCDNPCGCCCHDKTLIRASPPWLARFIGNLFLPRSLFTWSLADCNVQTCRRTRRDHQITRIHYFFPSWFLDVDMTIRLRMFPVHFRLQTPRKVPHDSPIFRCIEHLDIQGVNRLLLSGKASVNDVDVRGFGVLHKTAIYMTRYSHEQISPMFEFLVNAGAHTEWQDDFRRTAMRYIIQEQCNRKLIPSGLDSRPTSSLQLHIAGPIFQVSIIDIMEDWFEDYGFTDVHRAVLCHRDNGASLRNILQHSPADINTPCRRELTPLEWGVSMFIPDVVEILSECGADVHKNHPLHRAAESGNLGAFKSLIRFGADINLQDHVGRTALHRVAYWGYPAVVEELVQSHGDNLRLDLLDHSGRTVFDEIEHGSAYYKAMRWSTRGHDRIFNLLSHLRTSRAITDPHRSGSDGDVDFRIPGTFPKD